MSESKVKAFSADLLTDATPAATGEASVPECRMVTLEDGRTGLNVFVELPNNPPRTKAGEGNAYMLGRTPGFMNVPGTKSHVTLCWTVKVK